MASPECCPGSWTSMATPSTKTQRAVFSNSSATADAMASVFDKSVTNATIARTVQITKIATSASDALAGGVASTRTAAHDLVSALDARRGDRELRAGNVPRQLQAAGAARPWWHGWRLG